MSVTLTEKQLYYLQQLLAALPEAPRHRRRAMAWDARLILNAVEKGSYWHPAKGVYRVDSSTGGKIGIVQQKDGVGCEGN